MLRSASLVLGVECCDSKCFLYLHQPETSDQPTKTETNEQQTHQQTKNKREKKSGLTVRSEWYAANKQEHRMHSGMSQRKTIPFEPGVTSTHFDSRVLKCPVVAFQ